MESNEYLSYEEALKILSVAEGKVLERIEKGYTSVEIAEELGNSTRTIQTHIYNIHKKLNIKGRFGLRKWLWKVKNGND